MSSTLFKRFITIRAYREQLSKMGLNEREKYSRILYNKHLSPFFQNSLIDFQKNWDHSKSFEEFREAQDKKILECLELEKTIWGNYIRKINNLKPLNEEDKLE